VNNSYFLSAIVDRGPAGFESRTEVFCVSNLEDLLREFPLAITLEPAGQAAARYLSQTFANHPRSESASQGAGRAPSVAGRWRCYRWMFDGHSAHWLTFADDVEIVSRVLDLHAQSDRALAAFVREEALGNERLSSAVDAAIASAISLGRHGYEYALPLHSEALDRKAVLSRRHSLLERVPTFSIREISGSFDLTNCNASQRAADLRKMRRLFGVRAGWTWRYPKFQFDASRHVHLEMREVLVKLPDDLGWNRLEWFLSPHEALGGETPLTVWRRDRSLVVAAAATENWHRRRVAR
jgi:hypothetical protein